MNVQYLSKKKENKDNLDKVHSKDLYTKSIIFNFVLDPKPYRKPMQVCDGVTNMVMLKGAGGVDDPGKVKIKFSVVPDRWECQLPYAFYQIKK